MRVLALGLELDGPLVGGDRFFEAAIFLKGHAEVAPRFRRLGRHADGGAVGLDRLIDFPFFANCCWPDCSRSAPSIEV